MSHSTVFITPFIKPGGGPPGYVYGLRNGIDAIRSECDAALNARFIGRQSHERNRATGEGSGLAAGSGLGLLKHLRDRGVVNPFSSQSSLERDSIRACGVVIGQGYQSPINMRYAKMLGRVVGYMPHSPDIAAEEHKITEANAGKKISQRAYNRHFRREQALLSLSDFVVFPSYNASTAYRSRFSTVFEANKKVYYLESGVDVPEIDPNLAIPEVLMRAKDRTVVLFAGRYNSHKGYDLFCQAAEVFGEESDFCFFSAGGGPIATPDGGVVTDLGWQPNIHSILPHVDIVVIPNRIAYYDLWPLECAAFAKGLVMTAVGGSRDQLLDLPDTVSVGRASPRSIELGIREAKSELDKNKSWGALNKEAYLKKYTSRLFARRWSNTIEKIYSDYDSRLSKLQR